MADNRKDVLIAGAGIGGLTLALQLHQAGIPCRIIEAAPRLSPLGVGINILPHASRELHRLGLGPALDRVAVRTGESRFYNRFGQFIYAEPLGIAAGYPWPQYSIHRGDLQTVLIDAVRDRLGAQVLELDTKLVGAEQDSAGVTAVVQTADRRERTTAGVLVGCDGVHSAVRAVLYPSQPGPRYAGCTMWRGVSTCPPFLGGAGMVAPAGCRPGRWSSIPFGTMSTSRATSS